jgi:Zn-dependent protease
MALFLKILAIAPPLLFSVMLHEIAHGLVAERLGDRTARSLGRITLNPLKHIDPMMTLIFPALLIMAGSPIIFGGAKPVPINPLYFKNPRRGMAYVALAGPTCNFLLAALCYFMLNGALAVEHMVRAPSLLLGLVQMWLVFGLIINLVLALFNLFPIPPLDGGRIAVGFLPLPLARSWAKLEPFGLMIVFALLYFGVLDKLLRPAFHLVEHLPILQP